MACALGQYDARYRIRSETHVGIALSNLVTRRLLLANTMSGQYESRGQFLWQHSTKDRGASTVQPSIHQSHLLRDIRSSRPGTQRTRRCRHWVGSAGCVYDVSGMRSERFTRTVQTSCLLQPATTQVVDWTIGGAWSWSMRGRIRKGGISLPRGPARLVSSACVRLHRRFTSGFWPHRCAGVGRRHVSATKWWPTRMTCPCSEYVRNRTLSPCCFQGRTSRRTAWMK